MILPALSYLYVNVVTGFLTISCSGSDYASTYSMVPLNLCSSRSFLFSARYASLYACRLADFKDLGVVLCLQTCIATLSRITAVWIGPKWGAARCGSHTAAGAVSFTVFLVDLGASMFLLSAFHANRGSTWCALMRGKVRSNIATLELEIGLRSNLGLYGRYLTTRTVLSCPVHMKSALLWSSSILNRYRAITARGASF